MQEASSLTLREVTAASRTRAAKSAPESPSVAALVPMAARSTSAARGVARVSACRIAARPPGPGSATYNSLSSRPGLQEMPMYADQNASINSEKIDA